MSVRLEHLDEVHQKQNLNQILGESVPKSVGNKHEHIDSHVVAAFQPVSAEGHQSLQRCRKQTVHNGDKCERCNRLNRCPARHNLETNPHRGNQRDWKQGVCQQRPKPRAFECKRQAIQTTKQGIEWRHNEISPQPLQCIDGNRHPALQEAGELETVR